VPGAEPTVSPVVKSRQAGRSSPAQRPTSASEQQETTMATSDLTYAGRPITSDAYNFARLIDRAPGLTVSGPGGGNVELAEFLLAQGVTIPDAGEASR